MNEPGILLLEDGNVFRGILFGAPVQSYGEVVFTTSMTGYEQSVTDPSYRGQILVFSYPLIGNYRMRKERLQSDMPQVRGVVVSEYTSSTSALENGLNEFLAEHGIPALADVDTRTLVRLVREKGTMKGLILPGSPRKQEIDEHLSSLQKCRNVWEENLVAEVSVRKRAGPYGRGERVVVLDYGVKRNLIRDLSARFEAYVLPYDAEMEAILSLEPKGVVISSGPGDPSHPEIVERLNVIRKLCETFPVLGVCLGHQLIALAYGAKTYKLKFGHRGINHPVRFGEKSFVTSQNHGFSVNSASLEETELTCNQVSLNDG
ncbi:MAG: glutamine-hydrolyzing carbamoyl-phosphate synthase small subunit, partial [Methanomassiliicoccales archaeon]